AVFLSISQYLLMHNPFGNTSIGNQISFLYGLSLRSSNRIVRIYIKSQGEKRSFFCFLWVDLNSQFLAQSCAEVESDSCRRLLRSSIAPCKSFFKNPG